MKLRYAAVIVTAVLTLMALAGIQSTDPSVEADAVPAGDEGYAFVVDSKGVITDYRGILPADLEIPVEVDGKYITGIGEYAFIFCDTIENVTFEEGSKVESLGEASFAYCEKLESVAFPDSLKRIGESAFEECGLSGELTVPASVTDLGKNAFKGCTHVTSIVIDSGITAIPEGAFSGCSITSLTLSDNIVSVGKSSFKGCEVLATLTFGSKMKDIGESAFYGCSALTGTFSFPNSVLTIGAKAFSRTSLTGVDFGNGVETIGANAFSGCKGITGTVTLPVSIKSFNSTAFSGCTGVTAYGISESSEVYSSKNGILFGKADNVMVALPPGFTGVLEVPSDTVGIADGAAHGVIGLTGLNMAGTSALSSIGAHAFSGCTALTGTLTIPDTVVSVGESAFSGTGITGVSIGSGLKTIPKSMFYECAELTGTLTIPDTVTGIGVKAFAASGITGLVLGSGLETVSNMAFMGCSDLKGTLTIPDGVIGIGHDAFYKTGITGLTLGSGLKTVDYEAFSGCGSLTGTLTIPDSVTEIGSSAFYETGITGLTLGSGLETISSFAFANCAGISGKLSLPSSIKDLDRTAFNGCTGITEYEISGNSAYQTHGGILYNIHDRKVTLQSVPAGFTGTVRVDASVTDIGDYAAYGIPGIVSLDLSQAAALTSIGEDAFNGCVGLGWLVFGSIPSLTEIGDSAFEGCTSLDGSITLPDSVRFIRNEAFAGCASLDIRLGTGSAAAEIESDAFKDSGITGTFYIPAKLTDISDSAFEGCSGLSSFEADPKNTEYRTDGQGIAYSADGSRIVLVPPGFSGKLTIPNTVEEIGKNQFREIGMTELCFEEGSILKVIGQSAFEDCTMLMGRVTIPASVNTISSYAFLGCSSLQRLSFEDGEESLNIMNQAFYKCSMLSGTVEFPSRMTSVASAAFGGCNIDRYAVGSQDKYVTDDQGIVYKVLTEGSDSYKWVTLVPQTLESVTIPDDVDYISEMSFMGCSKLSGTLKIPAGVEVMQFDAFRDCSSLETVDMSACTGLTIMSSVFDGCTGLKKVILPDGVELDYDDTFDDCDSLRSIEFGGAPGSFVGSVNGHLFKDSVSASETTKAVSGVYVLDGGVFYKNLRLQVPRGIFTDVYLVPAGAAINTVVNAGNTDYLGLTIDPTQPVPSDNFVADSAELFDSRLDFKNYFFYFLENNELSIQAQFLTEADKDLVLIDTVEYYDFDGNKIAYTVTAIADGAYEYDDFTGKLTIPDTIKHIGKNVFAGKDFTGTLTIPEGVLSIGSGSFSGCGKFTSLSIPASVTEIGAGAFTGMGSLTGMTVDAGSIRYEVRGGMLIDKTENTVVASLLNVKGILTVPADIESIGESAFAGCDGMTGLQFADVSGLLSIGDGAFAGCDGLKTVGFPDKVHIISESAFSVRFVGSDGSDIEAGDAALLTGRSFTGDKGVLRTSDPVIGSGFLYSETDGSLTVIGYVGQLKGVLTIPDSHGGKSVVSIGDRAFYRMTGITGLEFGDSSNVLSIGDYAFAGCTGMKSVKFPSTLESMGVGCFSDSGIEGTLSFPAGVTAIPEEAFAGCPSVCSVEFGENILSIGEKAFGATALTGTLTIPGTVKDIGKAAFIGIESAFGLVIESGVESIGDIAFAYSNVTGDVTIPGSVRSVGNSAFEYAMGIKAVTVTDGVQEIGDFAFSESGVTSVTIPGSVTDLGYGAFFCCESLVSADVSAKNVAFDAFGGCEALKDLTLGSGMLTIGEKAFGGTAITGTLTIPSTVTSIGKNAFASVSGKFALVYGGDGTIGEKAFIYCENMTGADVSASAIGKDAFYGCENMNSLVLGEALGEIGEGAFSFAKLPSNLVIPAAVQSIGNGAFNNTEGLETVDLSKATGITAIGDRTFYNCWDLKSVTFPEGLLSIGGKAFAGTSLEGTVTLPSTLEAVSYGSFSGCSGITEFRVTQGGDTLMSVGGAVYSADGKELMLVPMKSSGTFTVPDTVVTVADGAFRGSGIEGLVFGPGSALISIGEDAFRDCSDLSGVIGLPAGLSHIGDRAFSGCVSVSGYSIPEGNAHYETDGQGILYTAHKRTVMYAPQNLESLVLSEQTMFIGDRAFSGCGIQGEVLIPRNMEKIGEYAFEYCDGITSFRTAPGSLLGEIGYNAFEGCSGITEVMFDEGHEPVSIKYEAFLGCGSIEKIRLPAGSVIGYHAFIDSEELLEVTFEGPAGATGYKPFPIQFEDADGRFSDDEDRMDGTFSRESADGEVLLKEYTVVFDSDGGTPVDAQTVRLGDRADRPVSEKEGFILAGWNLNGSPYDFSSEVRSDMVLTAVWKEPDPVKPFVPPEPVTPGENLDDREESKETTENDDGSITDTTVIKGTDRNGNTVEITEEKTSKDGITETKTDMVVTNPNGEKVAEVSGERTSRPSENGGNLYDEKITAKAADGSSETKVWNSYEGDTVTYHAVTTISAENGVLTSESLDNAMKVYEGAVKASNMQFAVAPVIHAESSGGAFTLPEDTVSKLKDGGNSVMLGFGTGKVSMDFGAVGSLSGETELSMAIGDASELNDRQKEAVGGGSFFSVTAKSSGAKVSEVAGKIVLTVPMPVSSLGADDQPAYRCYLVGEDGSKTLVDSEVIAGQIAITSPSFGVFAIEQDVPAPEPVPEPEQDGGSGFPIEVAAVIVLAIAAMAVTALVLRHR